MADIVTCPMDIDDPINRRILTVAEDQLMGFYRHPFEEISRRCGVAEEIVHQRLKAMLQAGVVRRIRQTLQAGNLADGALVAWKISEDHLQNAYDWLAANDPFTGHVVIRDTQAGTAGSEYRLWTTLKVPQGYDAQKHCRWLGKTIGAEDYQWLPTLRVFALGVGHVRRAGLEVGAMSDKPAPAMMRKELNLTNDQWRYIEVLKADLGVDEITHETWVGRAARLGMSIEAFTQTGSELAHRGVLRRFSVFLEHTHLTRDDGREARSNGLFQWSVPAGREIEAGGEIGRFAALTHVYWRQARSVFADANLFAVAHGANQEMVMAHKTAIDNHLAALGIPVTHTAVFWGRNALVRPSEILPWEYSRWCAARGIDEAAMRVDAG